MLQEAPILKESDIGKYSDDELRLLFNIHWNDSRGMFSKNII